jgi:RND family efflux transporter MFP subunit
MTRKNKWMFGRMVRRAILFVAFLIVGAMGSNFPVAAQKALLPGYSSTAPSSSSPTSSTSSSTLSPGENQVGLPELRAQLVPARYTTLSAEIPARIENIAVRESERFRKGQVLVAFDCAIQRAALEEAQATLKAAARTRGVTRRLVELQSGGVLDADVAAAKAAEAEARVHSAEAVVSKCAITAPFAGRVVEQKVRPHQYVQAGQALLEILDDSELEVEFIAPSNWLGWMNIGVLFQVQVEETRRFYSARISRIGAKVDAVSHSIKVTGTITEAPPELIAGMSGRVMLIPPSGSR